MIEKPMTSSANLTYAAERIESLKAGITGAAAMLPVLLLMIFLEPRLTSLIADPIDWSPVWQNPAVWLKGAIVLFSGFLFGATYRYVIRQDSNPHLKSGAVMAFGLVRGLAQVEVKGNQIAPLLLGLGVLESLLLFATAMLVLDWTIGQGWIKAFKLSPEP